jgi:hypothetical protein
MLLAAVPILPIVHGRAELDEAACDNYTEILQRCAPAVSKLCGGDLQGLLWLVHMQVFVHAPQTCHHILYCLAVHM